MARKVDKIEQRMSCECLSGRIRKLGRVVNSIFDGKYRPFGVRSSQVSILVTVGLQGPTTASDVCRTLCLEKSTLSRDLDRLIERGWIRAVEVGGRRQTLELTPAGRTLIEKTESAWDEAQAEVKKLLGDELATGLLRVVDESFAAEKSV